jgi:hypothetical protein
MMKTRTEMIYDFMVALSANAEVFKQWDEEAVALGSYSNHLKALAEELEKR